MKRRLAFQCKFLQGYEVSGQGAHRQNVSHQRLLHGGGGGWRERAGPKNELGCVECWNCGRVAGICTANPISNCWLKNLTNWHRFWHLGPAKGKKIVIVRFSGRYRLLPTRTYNTKPQPVPVPGTPTHRTVPTYPKAWLKKDFPRLNPLICSYR